MTGTFDRGLDGVVASAAQGDEIAFGRIVAAYHADMHRVCVFVCGDQSIAEDVVQAARVITWRKLEIGASSTPRGVGSVRAAVLIA